MMTEFVASCFACGCSMNFSFEKRGYKYFRCAECLAVSCLPIPSDSDIRRHYEANARSGNYALLRKAADDYRPIYQGFLQVLQEKLDARPGASPGPPKILEVGCFTGEFLSMARDAGMDVWGLELQKEAVASANERLGGRVWNTDVQNTNLPTGDFDAVCLFGVVEHVVEPVGLLRRCSELLRPNGILIIQTPDAGGWMRRLLGRLWPPFTPVEHIHLFSQGGLIQVLQRLGHRQIEARMHWKLLPMYYVYEMLGVFGREFQPLAALLFRVMPGFAKRARIPAYVGEMIVTSIKP